QSLKPIAHVPLHTEPAQVRVAMPWNEQLNAAPQPPQSLGLVVVSISHPSKRLLLLQSAKLLLHAPVQLPPVQAAVMLLVEHAAPQSPQLSLSVRMLVSQPALAPPPGLQSAKPGAHAVLHTPLVHPGLEMPMVGQTLPHVPQLLES